MHIKLTMLASALALAVSAAPVHAQVSEAEAARLGQDLTPMGAERAGNEAGTIPAWDGGLTSPPVEHEPGGHYADPLPMTKSCSPSTPRISTRTGRI